MRKLVLAAIAATTLFQVTTLKAAIIQEPDGTIRSTGNTPALIQIPRTGAGGHHRIWNLEMECEIGTSGIGLVNAFLGSQAAPAISFLYTGGNTLQISAAGMLPSDGAMTPGRIHVKNRLYPGTTGRMRAEQEITHNTITTKNIFIVPLHEAEDASLWDCLFIQLAGDAAIIKASLRPVSQSIFMVK